jgi:1-aminocyclopropane-1-carboxylate deaminase/D-cysteine desulfhydrase-like pyridoxal-dependent ACC family enzyme
VRVSATTVRNIAIVVGLALVVWLVPGGGTTAGIVEGLMYMRYRAEIFGLGDRHRAMLYGAVAVILVTLAASSLLFSTGPTTLIWLALIGAAVWTLVLVWRHWREYAF